MNELESPVEALALSYLTFGFLTAVNSIWTWIAVVTTAAVSVWKIRASSPVKIMDDSSTNQLAWFPSSSTVEKIAGEEPVSTSSESSLEPSPFFEEVGRTSGKFTLYYQEDENDFEDDDVNEYNNDGGAIEDADLEDLHWIGDDWEAVMNMRIGDMGWYRYQDSTVLDGSVVRLWEGRRRRRAGPLMTCGGRAVVAW